jgi:[acyl-carrier-protein] S-malonyltransferase
MQQAGLDENGEAKGAMAAGLGTRDKILAVVEQAREDGILEGVNFNSPKQTVVAGDKVAIERFTAIAKENKIKAIPLSVSTAFHSPMMVPAAEKLKDVLKEAGLKAPVTTVYADVTADNIMKDYDGNQDVADYLVDIMARQAMSPVYWEEIINRFEADGVEALIEVGPGTTLSGLTKKTSKVIKPLNVENVESLKETIAQLREMAQ